MSFRRDPDRCTKRRCRNAGTYTVHVRGADTKRCADHREPRPRGSRLRRRSRLAGSAA